MATLGLRSKHWIVDEKGNISMGEGRREIFEIIQRTGSLNQTAKIMKMSYRGVWGRIKATEKVLKKKLVYTDRKLGSSLTPEG
jgi:molybdate transport system regulatory protein